MYQNYDYDNDLDEYDGDEYAEEEEDELSPEDKVQMAEGTAEVRSALGTQAERVTTKQIQEALWHYYYDVDKSVAYLINKYIDPAPKPTANKPKPQSQKTMPPSSDGKRSRAPFLSSIDLPLPTGVPEADIWRVCAAVPSSSPGPRLSVTNFFTDMPWLNIPEDRKTVFIKPPRLRGGLLGGSSAPPKMSKLQALAAARKKKAEEAKKADEVKLVILPKENNPPGMKVPPQKESSVTQELPSEKKTAQVQLDKSHQELSVNSQAAAPATGGDSLTSTNPLKRPYGTTIDGTADDYPTVKKAKPSAFAQALLPSASGTPPAYQRLYSLPWMKYTTIETLQEAFGKPSPDDVVLAAQSQAGRSVNKGR